MGLRWATDIIDVCAQSGVAVFCKQLGTAWARESGTYAIDSKGGDMSVWPEELRIREYPETARQPMLL